MAQKGRPTKTQTIAIRKRDEDIADKSKKGYPLDYIASLYNLSKGRVVQILKKEASKVEGTGSS